MRKKKKEWTTVAIKKKTHLKLKLYCSGKRITHDNFINNALKEAHKEKK